MPSAKSVTKLPAQYKRGPCVVCRGAGKTTPPTPTDRNTEAYAQYISGYRPAPVKCVRCAGKGKLRTVNTAWLIQVRLHAGSSRLEFAKKVDVTYSHISNVENGYAACTPRMLALYTSLL